MVHNMHMCVFVFGVVFLCLEKVNEVMLQTMSSILVDSNNLVIVQSQNGTIKVDLNLRRIYGDNVIY